MTLASMNLSNFYIFNPSDGGTGILPPNTNIRMSSSSCPIITRNIKLKVRTFLAAAPRESERSIRFKIILSDRAKLQTK